VEQFGAITDKREYRNCDNLLKFRKQLVKKGTAMSASPGVVTKKSQAMEPGTPFARELHPERPTRRSVREEK